MSNVIDGTHQFYEGGHPRWGCLPRATLPGDRPMAEGRITLVPESEWDALAKQISLRPHRRTLLDQDGVGSCAAESSTQDLMLARVLAGLEHVPLNPWFVYHTTSGGRDGGSSIDDNLDFLMKYGCAPESVWPRSKGWRAEPSKDAYAAALEFRIDEYWDISTVAELVAGLLDACPAVIGAKGHAVCAVEHRGSYPLICNSWGQWEDDGYGKWCSYNEINWGYGAWAVRAVRQAGAMSAREFKRQTKEVMAKNAELYRRFAEGDSR